MTTRSHRLGEQPNSCRTARSPISIRETSIARLGDWMRRRPLIASPSSSIPTSPRPIGTRLAAGCWPGISPWAGRNTNGASAAAEVQLDQYGYPRWAGQPLEGRVILVHAEQGIGDEILFASCVPDLIVRAGHVVIVCDPRLTALFARSFPQATVHGIARRTDCRGAELSERIDYQIPAGSLPRYFRATAAAFPHRRQFLVADRQQLSAWRKRLATLGAGLKVGISWRRRRKAARAAQANHAVKRVAADFDRARRSIRQCSIWRLRGRARRSARAIGHRDPRLGRRRSARRSRRFCREVGGPRSGDLGGQRNGAFGWGPRRACLGLTADRARLALGHFGRQERLVSECETLAAIVAWGLGRSFSASRGDARKPGKNGVGRRCRRNSHSGRGRPAAFG